MSDFRARMQNEGRNEPAQTINAGHLEMLATITGKQVDLNAIGNVSTLLQVDGSGRLTAGGMTLTKVGLIVPDDQQDRWRVLAQLVRTLFQIEGSVAWLVGDALNLMQRGRKFSHQDMAEMFGRDLYTIYNWTSVAARVEISRRREILSYSHHVEVAALDDGDEQTAYLLAAETNGWSVAQLRRAIAGHPEPERATLVDRTLAFGLRVEKQAAKLTQQERLDLADEFDRLAGRLRLMGG